MKLKEYIKTRTSEIENVLENLFTKKYNDSRDGFLDILAYPVKAGGKRVRPLLTLMSCELFDREYEKAVIPACALELIHTYSLIHDDLPAMDNDSIRRGLPTTHVKYGEANAILAGDGLLTHAFEILSMAQIDDRLLRPVLYEISHAAGIHAMVMGQYIDLYYEKKEIDFQTLKIIHGSKTGAMIRGAVRTGAIIGYANDEELKIMTKYGELIGLAFQIQDDILDEIADEKELGKTVGKDEKNGKLTYVKQLTLKGAKKEAKNVTDEAVKTIEKLSAKNKEIVDILTELAYYIIERGS